ncbi:nucleoid-structuring protein H-NS [candidate division WOR-1 bacterium RIFCSPLOWO2_02_FULL_46_20]|uniref:Nucleoid-structuring protein H-NS n=1 Tax=candidate division WOR-1 bacterium RIFCSPLOWO2_02_FULL_46_20 TaxID=1802567 RepID=A0A1F4R8W8_UNCSA|nr:MAG: nucleoid-structuring protein H-NS [candidate division WOR-1 bacterium RIFCSPHIGHO2_02_FULL_45_12]OGC04600.1 MAG: nucleoid-structuring protein H-NS [candidate division WOR-1 bacterium RIFCSPLOWO2_02_FULL_46_20]
MFRPEIKVLDCTLRDGGLINDHCFDEGFVKAVFRATALAGIDYVELGYRASKKSFSPDKYGECKFCDEDFVRKVTDGVDNKPKISVMVDIGRIDEAQIPDKKDSVVDLVRVACYIKDVDKAIKLVNFFHDKGYETTCNIMAISTALIPDVEEGLAQLAESPVGTVYVVDSYGSMFSEQIHFLTKLYGKYMWPKKKEVGMHAHNNQQLGFANTIEAVRMGANYLDSTIYGIGRGAGNCPTELLLSFLKNPKFRLEPILEVIEKELVPLSKQIEWGYIIPYMITGILNQHPRAAIALRAGKDKDKFAQFYRDILI